MKKIFFLSVLMFCSNFSYSQSKKIEIFFVINDSIVDIRNDFNVYLVIVDSMQKLIIKPTLTDNVLIIDTMLNKINGKKFYVFSYLGKEYYMSTDEFSDFENMNFELSYRDKNITNYDNKINAIFSITFNPKEWGRGTVHESNIEYIEDFFQIGKNLINIDIPFY